MNFDNITAGNIGAISYLGREIVKPAELIGLWTLGDGVYSDLSRYGGGFNSTATTTASNEYGFPLSKHAQYTVFTFSLGHPLNLSQDWSFEGYFRDASGRPWSWLDIGSLKVQAGTASDDGDNLTLSLDGTRLARSGSWRNPKGLVHRAVTYNAATNTITVYKNGARQNSVVQALSGSVAVFTYSFGGAGFNDGDVTYGGGNIRICQKLLGDGTTYPTPTGLYTGFETL